jgi:hypothetical protein
MDGAIFLDSDLDYRLEEQRSASLDRKLPMTTGDFVKANENGTR